MLLSLIDRDKMRLISKDRILKDNLCDTHSDVIRKLSNIIQGTEEHLKKSKIEKTVNWMLYEDLWLDNEDNKLPQSFYNYSRGDIILSLDLGSVNIGTEIRYPHPCVVLYDNREDWVIVAPITSAQIDRVTQQPIIHTFEVFIQAQRKPPRDSKEFYFKKNSVIQVDQICRVSKYRAVNKTKLKIRVDLLNQIDNIILKNYIPVKNKLLEELKQKIESLNFDLSKKEEEIIDLTSNLNKKDGEIALLKEQIQELKLENRSAENSL